MCKEFIRSRANARAANNFARAEGNMAFARCSIVAGATMLVLVECGYAVYHLSLMVW